MVVTEYKGGGEGPALRVRTGVRVATLWLANTELMNIDAGLRLGEEACIGCVGRTCLKVLHFVENRSI